MTMWLRILAAVWIAGAALAAAWRPGPPDPAPASAPAAAFSAERALAHVRAIAARPHPTGSAAHAQVRDYILAELARLGIPAEVARATSAAEFAVPAAARYRVAARVQNIVARLAGQRSTGAVVLMAHYDSVAAGPGASDNGAGVAALLEAARALQAGGPRANDIVLLFTDAEEIGLLGSQAFFDAPPVAGPLAAVLNFEARGRGGPALMFESTPGSAWLVRELAAACPHARASSLFDAVSRYVPNTTDFAHARARGIPGLNFAYIGGILHYHNALDSAEHLDPGSLQHHGDYALGLAQRLAARDLSRPEPSDAVFFEVPGALVIYPAGASAPLAVIAVALWLAVVGRGIRTGALGWRRVAASAGAKLLEVIAAAIAAGLVTFAAARAHPEFRRIGDAYEHGWYAAAIGAACAALAAAALVAGRRRWSALEVAAGAAVPWVLLAAATAAWLPGAAFFFTWPVAGSALGLAILLRRSAPGARDGAIALTLQAAPVALLVAPVIPLLLEGLTLRMAPVAAAVTALALGLLAPHLDAAMGPRRWRWPAALAAAALGCVVVASWPRAPGAERPRQNSLLYAQDADAGRAIWASSDAAPDDWTRRFLGSAPARGALPAFMPAWDRDFWQAPAPVVPLARPEVTVLGDATAGAVRTLRARVASPRGARSIGVALGGARVLAYRVDGAAARGAEAPAGDAPWELWLEGGGAAPWELEWTLAAGAPVTIRVLDRSDGLPEVGVGPRPRELIPASSLDVEMWSHATFTSRAISLSPAPEMSSRYKSVEEAPATLASP